MKVWHIQRIGGNKAVMKIARSRRAKEAEKGYLQIHFNESNTRKNSSIFTWRSWCKHCSRVSFSYKHFWETLTMGFTKILFNLLFGQNLCFRAHLPLFAHWPMFNKEKEGILSMLDSWQGLQCLPPPYSNTS